MTGETSTAGQEAWRERGGAEERRATRTYMIARSLAGPAAAAYALRTPGELPTAFWVLFAVAHVLGFAAVLVAYSSRWRVLRPEYTLPLDIAALSALLALSGGAQSELRNVVLAFMIAPAIVMSPRVVAFTGAGILAGYLAVAVPDLVEGEGGAPSAVTSYALGLVWVTGTAALLSALRTSVADRLAGLLAGRRLMLRAVLDSEARERRRLTRDLHEGALQLLLAARQDLEEARDGDPQALARAELGVMTTIDQLRETIADVHPVALDHGGLAAALRAIAERAAQHGDFDAHVQVDPASEGLRDDVLVNVARELIGNAVDHAAASRLDVLVRAESGALVLEVVDDGVGFDPGRLRPDGVGLAACAERIRSADGSFQLESAPGAGTRVRVALPPPARRGGGRFARATADGPAAPV